MSFIFYDLLNLSAKKCYIFIIIGNTSH